MIFWDVVERHLDEAEFLWGVWEHSLRSPNYTLDEVAGETEERLLAHVDGLVANGPEVTHRMLKPALEGCDPHRVSAAALALLKSPGEEGGRLVIEALRSLSAQREALTRALACADGVVPMPRLRELLGNSDPSVVVAAAEVLHFHQVSLGHACELLWASSSPAARALALKALPDEPDGPRRLTLLREGLRSGEPLVVAAAMEAGCRLGLDEAWQRVQERASRADAHAMLLLALAEGQGERRELFAALGDPARRAAALWALGFVGTPEAVEASLEFLQDPRVCRLAGEVFVAMTGIGLKDVGALAALEEEDESLDQTAEDELPRPDPARVRQWWGVHRGGFLSGQRYLMGKPYSLKGLFEALARGPMRRRPALALALQLSADLRPSPRLQTLAFTHRQYTGLETLRLLVGMDSETARPRS